MVLVRLSIKTHAYIYRYGTTNAHFVRRFSGIKNKIIAAASSTLVWFLIVASCFDLSSFGLSESKNILLSYGTITNNEGLSKLRVVGILLKDSSNRTVKLAGFNVHSFHSWKVLQVSEEDIAWVKNNGFNAVRVVVYWSDIEKNKGVIDETFFLNYLDPLINWCEKYRVYVIIDLHQWNWSPYWDGYGVPTFYVNMYPNSSDGMTQCALDFWAGVGPGAIAKQRFVEIWRYIANRYNSRNVIAAYDLFNEPYAFYNSYEYRYTFWPQVMKFFNEQLVPAIRAVDPNTIIIYDAFYEVDLNTLQAHENIVWGRSWYDYSAENVGNYSSELYESDIQSRLAEYTNQFFNQFNAPFIILEIGGDQFLGNNLQWFNDSLRIFENLTNNYGSFFQWCYGKDDSYGWVPLTSNFTDKPLVAILQKYAS